MFCVGDGAVGKTSMILSYTTNKFPEDHVPTIFDNYSSNIMIDSKAYKLGLWDTAGQDGEYDKIRPLSYPGTDVFILCYSVIDMDSFNHVTSKWIPEVTGHSPNTPIILVATKSDLRTNTHSNVTTSQGESLREQQGLFAHIETSSLKGTNLKLLFETAAKCAISKRIPPKSQSENCCSLQ